MYKDKIKINNFQKKKTYSFFISTSKKCKYYLYIIEAHVHTNKISKTFNIII